MKYKESKDLHCFQVSKLITRLLRPSKQVRREEDGGVHYDQIIDECKKKLSENPGHWSGEMKKQFAFAPHWSIEKWISILANGGGQKNRFQLLREPELFTEIPVPSSNPRTFRNYNQSCSARQCSVTQKVSPSIFFTSETEKN